MQGVCSKLIRNFYISQTMRRICSNLIVIAYYCAIYTKEWHLIRQTLPLLMLFAILNPQLTNA